MIMCCAFFLTLIMLEGSTAFHPAFHLIVSCGALYFHCSLGGCIPLSRVCDGVNDCPNNEDEQVYEFYYLGSSSVRNVTEDSNTLHFADGPGPLVNDFQCHTGNSTFPLTQKK